MLLSYKWMVGLGWVWMEISVCDANKGRPPEKKELYVGIFPTWADPPPVWERPCHKKNLRFILCFKAS